MNLTLTYDGNTLPAEITQYLINYSENKLNVPPSYLITKLHYEGLWGGSGVGQANNNWAGMTWNSSWTEPYKRPSGVTVTRGTARPSVEGGYYIKYGSVDDFLKDWTHLIRLGGAYNVGNSSTFDEAVKGMFIYGGAQYDYATMNVSGSKRRYELYLAGMKARRTAINNANNGILDELDSNDYSTDDKKDVGNEFDKPIGHDLDSIFSDLALLMTNTVAGIQDFLINLFNPFIYDYGNSRTKSNRLLTVTQISRNLYKIEMTLNVKDIIKDGAKNIIDNVQEKKEKEKEILDPGDEGRPNNNQPAIPHKQPYRITSPWGWRVHPITGNRKFHAGTDFADMTPGNKVPVYATQNAEVTVSNFSNTGGWMVYLKHTGDKYHSRYLHLDKQPMVSVGDTVKKGQKIGISGTTGASSGVHLHFEVATSQDGFGTESGTIDPEKYLKMTF